TAAGAPSTTAGAATDAASVLLSSPFFLACDESEFGPAPILPENGDFFTPQNHRLLTTAILLGAHSYDKTGTSAFFDVGLHPFQITQVELNSGAIALPAHGFEPRLARAPRPPPPAPQLRPSLAPPPRPAPRPPPPAPQLRPSP